MGIKEKIEHAENAAEIESLLKQTETLTDVPPLTKERWKRVAVARSNELIVQNEKKIAVEKKEEKKEEKIEKPKKKHYQKIKRS